ncbi:RipA family octameric membrane protein [Streptomyces roseoverticillatus]|uniref:Small integral membrane protein n=1 Tax=Streptomyces roseoverticillatus TaxID=66429 RepID=A0ABV3IM92_9ACTN
MSEPLEPSQALLELYKTAVEMADRVSARRGVSNSFFLTVQTAFVSVVALGGPHLANVWWASLAVALAGAALSSVWWLQLKSYRDLNAAKFIVINKLEEQLPAKIFSDEWATLKPETAPEASPSWRKRYVELGLSERQVPIVFAVLHLLLFLGRLFT